MDGSVRCLDHCGIRKFRPGFAIERQYWFPVAAIFTHGDIDHFPPAKRPTVAMRMIIDQQVTTIQKRDGINPAVRIGEIGRLQVAPGPSLIRRRGRKNLTIAVTVTTQCLNRSIRMPQECRLDCSE